MNCPKCGCCVSRVNDTKQVPEEGLIRRYRECKQCHHHYVTHERLAIYAGKSRGFVEDCPAACG